MTTYTSPFAGNVIEPSPVSYAAYTITANTTFSWPINGNTSTNVVASIMEISAGSTSGLSIYMPPANQVSVGQATTIKNTGSQYFIVLDNTGGTICTITSNQAVNIFVTDNTTVAGTWDIVTLGSGGSSAANAASLAGKGLNATGSTLNVDYPPSGLTDGYTFLPSDLAQTKIWSGGFGAATLPTSSTIGANWNHLRNM